MLDKIIIGCDHLGRELKDSLKEHLTAKGIKVTDIGVNSDDNVDYPDIGKELSKESKKMNLKEVFSFVEQVLEWQ